MLPELVPIVSHIPQPPIEHHRQFDDGMALSQDRQGWLRSHLRYWELQPMPLKLKRPMIQKTVNALNAESIAFQHNCRRLNANLSIAEGHMRGEISSISREETTALDRNYLVARRRADRRMKTLTSALCTKRPNHLAWSMDRKVLGSPKLATMMIGWATL